MGKRLIFQSTRDKLECDQIFIMNADGSDQHMVSTGKGRTTCGYFLADNRHILYASTHEAGDACPPPADRSKGYVWAVYPGYDIYLATDDGKIEKTLTGAPGYDAEATVNWKTGKIVYTSMASGDLDLWTMNPDGSGEKADHQGRRLRWRRGILARRQEMVWRANHPSTPETEKKYRDLLQENLTSPMKMELFVADADGKNAKQITNFGCASFAPTFTPDGKQDPLLVEQARLRRPQVRAVHDQPGRHRLGTGDGFRRLHGLSGILAGRQEAGLRVGQGREAAVRVQHFHGRLEVIDLKIRNLAYSTTS